MKTAFFNAVCPFEIGDKVILFKDGDVNVKDTHTITDIMAIHKLKSGTVEFLYEVDNDENYIKFRNL